MSYQGQVTNTGNPFAQSLGGSDLSPFANLSTIQQLINGAGLPQSVPAQTIGPIKPNDLPWWQRLSQDTTAAVSGLTKGVLPVGQLPLTPDYNNMQSRSVEDSYRYNPEARAIESIVQTPTALISNIIGAMTTGGAYNAAYSGISTNARSKSAIDTALKAGNFEVARKIQDAQAPAVALSAAYGLAGAKIPMSLGAGVTTRVATGAALGYPQDIADQALDQYALTGKVDARQLNYAPGLGTLIGAGIPGGSHFLSNATARNTAFDALRTGIRATADTVNQRARTAHPGFMRIGGSGDAPGQLSLDLGVPKESSLPLQADYRRGNTERQYAGQMTGERVPVISSSAMQTDADKAVQKAIGDGEPKAIQAWITHYESQGDALRANALRQSVIDPETISKVPADMAAQISREHEASASEAGRLLQSYQNNPLYRQQREFVTAGVDNLPKNKTRVVEDAGKAVKDLVDESFGDLYTIILKTFKLFMQMPSAPRKGKVTGKTKVARPKGETPKAKSLKLKVQGEKTKRLLARALTEDPTQPRKERKQSTINIPSDEQKVLGFAKERLRAKAHIRRVLESSQGNKKAIVKKPYKFTAAEKDLLDRLEAKRKADAELRKLLKVKRVKELTAEAAFKRQQQKVRKALDAEQRRARNEAMSAIARMERVVNKQLSIPLRVQAKARQISQEAFNTLSQEEQAYFKALVDRRNRAMLLGKLDQRLTAATQRTAPKKGETLRHLFERLAPSMSAEELDRYGKEVKAVEKRRFLESLTRKGSVRTKRRVLDKLLDAHGHDLLGASTPEVFGAIIDDSKTAIVMSKEDWRKLNAYAVAAADPMLAPKDRIRANALIEKLIADQKNETLMRKWFTFRAQGLLFQSATQAKNYLDQTISWSAFRLGSGLRELGSFGYSRIYGNEYGIEGGGNRGLVLNTSKEAKQFYAQHETGVKDELSNTLYDVKSGTNTSRMNGGDINTSAQPRRTLLHTRLKGKVGNTLRAADQLVGGIFRTTVSSSERLAYVDAYRVQLTHDIEVYRRVTGNNPDVKSDIYKNMRQNAVQMAEQVTLTNRGIASNVSRRIQSEITENVDAVARRARLIKKSQTLSAGEAVIPFPTVPANAWLRPAELIPVLGGVGIWGNRSIAARSPNAYFNPHQVAGEIVASQFTGLALTAGAAGGAMMYSAGYYGAINIRDKDKDLAAEQTAQAAGRGRGTINFSAFGRYAVSGKPQDFIAQPEDITFNMMGISSMFAPMAYMTATGREDAKNGKAYEERANVTRLPENVLSGAGSVLFQNDSFRGLNRAPNTLMETRNPETGEIDAATGAQMVAADALGFRIPGSDIFPQTIKEPRSTGELWASKFPLIGEAVMGHRLSDKTDPAGNTITRQGALSLLGHVADTDTYIGYMNLLHNETGKATHLLGSIPRTIKATNSEGQEVKANLSKQERIDAGNILKQKYAELVEQIRGVPNFTGLSSEQKVSVLSRVKNDVIRAYLAHPYDSSGGAIHRPAQRILKAHYTTKGGVRLPKPGDSGAYALYTGNKAAYDAFILRYIQNAIEAKANETGTIQANKALEGALP